jgi:hypothetical protein
MLVNSIFFPSSALLLACIGQLVTFLMFRPSEFLAVFVILFLQYALSYASLVIRDAKLLSIVTYAAIWN